MKLYKPTKLNTKGFGHHIVLPVLVIAVIALVGVRVMLASHAASPQSIVTSSAKKSVPLSIRVNKRGKLVNEKNRQIRLLGVDASGTEAGCVDKGEVTDGPPISQADANAIASWHVNVVRVPLNEDCWLGINGVSINGESSTASAITYKQGIENWVTDLNNAGIYVILDLHWSAPGSLLSGYPNILWDMPDEDHAPLFWQQVATTFKSNPAVIFDLFNEPALGGGWHSSPTSTSPGPTTTDWSCWKNGCQDIYKGVTYQVAGMQQLVDKVRNSPSDTSYPGAGATQPIMLGGLNSSADPCGIYVAGDGYAVNSSGEVTANGTCQWLANKPIDPLNQLIVSLHNYSWYWQFSTISEWNAELDPLKTAKIPFVTGEFGEADCTASYTNSYLGWADQNDVSYLAWTWGLTNYTTGEACVSESSANFQLLQNWNGTPDVTLPWASAYQSHLAMKSVYSTEK